MTEINKMVDFKDSRWNTTVEFCGEGSVFRYHLKTHLENKHKNTSLPPHQGQGLKGKVKKVGGTKEKGMRPQKRWADCGKLISAGNFKLYQIVHSKETLYVCKYCHKGFSQLNSLKRHLSCMHTEVGDHKCKVCGEGFSFKFDLKKTLGECAWLLVF